MTTSVNRPPLKSLSCVNADCEQYGRSGQNNLILRKIYGKDQIRYLRCRCCGEEFSERKLTGLWNCKLPEARAIRVSQQLAEGTSFNGTARLTNRQYRIPRTLAHVQIVKHRQGNQLEAVAVAKAHGSWRRIQQALDELGYRVPNTSTVERFNATARRMNAHQVRRSLAFAHCPQTRNALAAWSKD